MYTASHLSGAYYTDNLYLSNVFTYSNIRYYFSYKIVYAGGLPLRATFSLIYPITLLSYRVLYNAYHMEFPKIYTPSVFEDYLAKMWEEKGCYAPHKSRTGETFYIPLPPPNVTGVLHTGHALMLAIEDVMVRYHRMKGDETLWVPGTDHAGISTQNVVAKNLQKEGIHREDL